MLIIYVSTVVVNIVLLNTVRQSTVVLELVKLVFIIWAVVVAVERKNAVSKKKRKYKLDSSETAIIT